MKSILTILATICGLFVFQSCQQQSGEAQVNSTTQAGLNNSSRIPSVQVVKPSIRSFSSDIVISGSIKPDKMVTLHAMEQGFLKSISVDIGDRVKKGQALAILSNPMLRYEVKAATVKIKEAEAKLKSAQAELKLTEVDATIKQSMYEKLQSVYDQSKGLTTITELDNAKRNAQVSAAKKGAALANLDRYLAEIDAAKAMKAAITERQGMLTIRAPFSGVIAGRYVDPGAMVQSALTNNSAMPIVAIESTSPVRLSLPLPESDITGINVGDPVTIEFPTLPGEALHATITRVAKSLDASSKTMEVQVDLPNKDGKIKAGMYAKATIKRASSNNILSLPNAAVLMKKDAAFVMLVKNDMVEELQLKKGISGKDHFEVLNTNLSINSQVITKGKSSVKAGQKVTAVLAK